MAWSRKAGKPSLLRAAGSLLALALFSLVISSCAEGGDFSGVAPGWQTVTVTVTAAQTPVTAALEVNVNP
jgi:hypothetical protein